MRQRRTATRCTWRVHLQWPGVAGKAAWAQWGVGGGGQKMHKARQYNPRTGYTGPALYTDIMVPIRANTLPGRYDSHVPTSLQRAPELPRLG